MLHASLGQHPVDNFLTYVLVGHKAFFSNRITRKILYDEIQKRAQVRNVDGLTGLVIARKVKRNRMLAGFQKDLRVGKMLGKP